MSDEPRGDDESLSLQHFSRAFGVARPSLREVEASFAVGGVAAHLTVREAAVDEALDEPFEATVEVLAESEVAMGSLPGAAARLVLARHARFYRSVAGVVRRADDLGVVDGKHRLRFTVAPHLWLLSLRVDCRIFQDESVCDVVDAVLDAANLYRGAHQRSWARVERSRYPRREYCVQYQESDLAFVSRLLQEEGIAYLVDADEVQGERVVFFDALHAAEPVALLDDAPIAVRGAGWSTAQAETIRHFDWSERLQSRSVTLRDYDFTRVDGLDAATVTRPAQGGDLPVYEYPGRFTLARDGSDPRQNHLYAYGPGDGEHRADVALQALQSDERRGSGVANAIHFAPGRRFRVVDHGRAEFNHRAFVLARVRHTFRASEATRTDAGHADHNPAGEALAEGYQNRFECVAAELAYRPWRATPRPTIHGAQTAVVVAPEGEDVHVDTHGRVKVRFLWDRARGLADEHRTCWIRVAQSWAGAQWGFSFVPRRDMEVIVHFLEGNPDRPMLGGSVYNGANRTSYPLDEARNRTKSWIRTQTTPRGPTEGYNELRFDDLQGHEEVAIRAQRDLNERVLHDHATSVARHESNSIGGNQRNSIGGNRTSTVGRNETVRVMQGRELTVENNDAVVIGESQTTIVNMGPDAVWPSAPPRGAALKIAGEWNIEVTERIVVRVGETRITVTPQGVELSCPGHLQVTSGSMSLASRGETSVHGATLKLASVRSALLTSGGPTSVVGTPVQLNGPGLFAGRVTDAAPAAITTGAALVVIGGPSFELPVERRASDGALLVGRRIVILPGATPGSNFPNLVLRDLGLMASTPSGRVRLDNIELNPHGHSVTIREYVAADANRLASNGVPFGWNNSLASAQGNGNALRHDAQGNPVANTGSPSMIAYNPAIVLGPQGSPEPADAVLFHEMGHAEHNAYGVNRSQEPIEGWTDQEDWQDIEGGINRPGGGNDIAGTPRSPTENEYLADRNYPYRRTDHGAGYAPVPET